MATTKERSVSAVAFGSGTGMSPFSTAAAPGFVMLPRCTLKIRECEGGCCLECCCDDAVACGMLQNLCRMAADGVCGFTCLLNGQCICSGSFCCGRCTCELTANGCCWTCTSGDEQCCAMIRKCCECIECCLAGGCTCCLTINGMPVCCCAC